MKRLLSTGSIIAISLFLVFPTIVSAQIFSGGDHEKTFFGFEASGNYSMNDNVLEEVNDGIQTHIDHYITTYPSITPLTPFEEVDNIDYRFGFRFGNLHVGGIFNETDKTSAGFESNMFFTQSYDLTVNTREFLIYAGYMVPLTHWFEIGAFYAYGFGNVKGSLENQFAVVQNGKADLTGEYTPTRLEGKARLHLTKYIAIDFIGGVKTSEIDDVKADYGLGAGEYAVADYSENPMTFDWSGTFYSVGLTLKNPLGK